MDLEHERVEAGPVSFGAYFLGADPAADRAGRFSAADFGRAAESVGFDSVWTGDHVVDHHDAIANLGALAAATTSMQIGTAVVVLPLRPAAITAKGILTAALVADGRRTILGAGPGGDVIADFDVVGADPRTAGAYSDEALEVIRRLWTGRKVSFSGRWNSFTDVQIRPLPAKRPEIFIGGRSEVALRRALRFGDGYLPYLLDPAQARRRFEKLVALNAGTRSLSGFTFGIATFLVAGATSEHAASIAARTTGFGGVDDMRLRRFYVLGSPEECHLRLRDYVLSGANHVLVGCSAGHPRQLDSYMETMSAVLPRLRQEIAEGFGAESRGSLIGLDPWQITHR
jgi:alkanesulfonate monooxygenase SsuD/methylene tetrahydromethanopterin reductase-like flavin-dependent oxidoreductase (luciferase family)